MVGVWRGRGIGARSGEGGGRQGEEWLRKGGVEREGDEKHFD